MELTEKFLQPCSDDVQGGSAVPQNTSMFKGTRKNSKFTYKQDLFEHEQEQEESKLIRNSNYSDISEHTRNSKILTNTLNHSNELFLTNK